jgi:hypothetical protein
MRNLSVPIKKRRRRRGAKPITKKRNKRGRPSKLTPDVEVTICLALYDGKTMTAACREAGVALTTVMEWQQRKPRHNFRYASGELS